MFDNIFRAPHTQDERAALANEVSNYTSQVRYDIQRSSYIFMSLNE